MTRVIPHYPIDSAAENGVELIRPYNQDIDGPVAPGHVLLSGKEGAQRFLVSKKAARHSVVVASLLDDEDCQVVPLPEIPDSTLRLIATWLQHYEDGMDEEKELTKPLPGYIEDNVSEWAQKFLYTHLIRGGDEADNEALLSMTFGANFMNIQRLMDVCCASIASLIKGKTPQQIRDVLHIENDLTPEEEERIAEENRWCEEQ